MIFVKQLCIGMTVLLAIWFLLNRKPNIWNGIRERVENTKDRNIVLLMALLILLVEGSVVLFRQTPFVADEVYSMSGAAFFAGYDWSNYMSLHKFYNFGYAMLFAPLYKVFTDPVFIYQGMLFGNVILFVCIYIMAYYIARKHLQLAKLYSAVIALVCSYNSISLFFKGYLYNELPLAFIMWITLLLLLELSVATGKKRVVLSGVLGIITAYAYLVHSRCLILYGTLVVLVLLFLLIYKKWIVQPLSFGVAFGVCFCLEKLLLQYVQTNLYLQGTEVVMKNSVEHMATGTWQYKILGSLEGIGKLIAQFFSLAGAMTIETGGLVTVVSAVALYYLYKNFRKLRTGEMDKAHFLLTVFSFVSFWGMVVCIALFGASNSKPRFLMYSRYFSPFIGPFLFLGLERLKNDKQLRLKWILIWSTVLTMIVGLTYLFYTYPLSNDASMKENASLYLFMPFSMYNKQVTFSKNVFFIAMVLLLLFTVLLLYLNYRKQFVAFCMVSIAFSAILVWRVELRQNQPAAERRYEMCDTTYKVLHADIFEDVEIHCDGDDMYEKSVLVMCYDKEIVYNLEGVTVGEGDVLLSNSLDYIETYAPQYIYQLDDGEYMAVWDEDVHAYLQQHYELYKE